MKKILWIALLFLLTIPCLSQAMGPYSDNGNGTVTDQATGLVWQKSANDQQMTWPEALSYCENLIYGGRDDWRLPNIQELRSLVDYNSYAPAIDDETFSCMSAFYWSSTSRASGPAYAWGINFYAGAASWQAKTKEHYVRCVRKGTSSEPPEPTWIEVGGQALTEHGEPVCAMILANGQYIFSSASDGSFDLEAPLDKSGRITLFAFADGFAPFKRTIIPSEAANFHLTMPPADPGTPDLFLTTNMDAGASQQGWVRISGEVDNGQGTPVCAMVLANGQYVFSSSTDGSFTLEVPLDENGQVTIFVFADNFKPYKEVLTY